MTRADRTLDGVQRLEALTGVEHHGLRVGIEVALLEELADAGAGNPARRLGEYARGTGEQADALADLVVVDVLHPTARSAYRLEGVEAGGRVADVERLGDAGRPYRDDLVGRGAVRVAVQRDRDGVAAGRLGAVDPASPGRRSHQPDLDQFGERLLHFGQQLP